MPVKAVLWDLTEDRLVGAIIMQTIHTGGTQLGVDPFVLQIIIGALIPLSVGIDQVRVRRRGAARCAAGCQPFADEFGNGLNGPLHQEAGVPIPVSRGWPSR